MTPQIDHLGKMSTVLSVSIPHFYGISQEIDGKTFNFRVNLGNVTSQIELSQKNEHCSEGFNTHLWGF